MDYGKADKQLIEESISILDNEGLKPFNVNIVDKEYAVMEKQGCFLPNMDLIGFEYFRRHPELEEIAKQTD